MRQVLSFILLLIFSATTIPVQATGKLLASNQLQEEVLEDAHHAVDTQQFDSHTGSSSIVNCNFSALATIDRNLWSAALLGERIPLNHADEKLVPPPNRILK